MSAEGVVRQVCLNVQRHDSFAQTDQAGVGLFFQQTEGNRTRVYVKTIVKGGSADRCVDVPGLVRA